MSYIYSFQKYFDALFKVLTVYYYGFKDFEDWDDVGLNIPKPPNLLQLYRNYCRYIYLHNEVSTKEVQTDSVTPNNNIDQRDICMKESCVSIIIF